MRIQFVISGLGSDGAQKMLLKLVSHMDRKQFTPEVVTLTDPVQGSSSIAEALQDEGVTVKSMGMTKSMHVPMALWKMVNAISEFKPHLVQTWMYHSDLIGGLSAKIAGRVPVYWNIRHSNLDANVDQRTTILTAKLCAKLSRSLPEYIVCCSEVAKGIHERLGYDPGKLIVIPNGFDLQAFSPDEEARHRLRKELGLSNDKILIGLVGRYHPQKDHKTFIRAAAMLNSTMEDVEFLLCGRGTDWLNEELVGLLDSAGLRSVFHLLGHRNDVPEVLAALDLAASTSACGEGFSNTIGEAMACGIPCVVTDVGDSSLIVGETGRVVSPENPEETFNAWSGLISAGYDARQEMGRQSRRRILELFSIDRIVDKYQDLYLRSMDV